MSFTPKPSTGDVAAFCTNYKITFAAFCFARAVSSLCIFVRGIPHGVYDVWLFVVWFMAGLWAGAPKDYRRIKGFPEFLITNSKYPKIGQTLKAETLLGLDSAIVHRRGIPTGWRKKSREGWEMMSFCGSGRLTLSIHMSTHSITKLNAVCSSISVPHSTSNKINPKKPGVGCPRGWGWGVSPVQSDFAFVSLRFNVYFCLCANSWKRERYD